MNYRENLSLGLEGIRAHMLRSLLTMLGIIFGVGAVISMLSIGEGAKQQALEQIQLMGMSNVIVEDIPIDENDVSEKRSNLSRGLSWADARAVEELNPLVDITVPQRELSLDIRYKNERTKTTVVGTTPEYGNVMNYIPREGSFFNYLDLNEARRVCVLGGGIKRKLFFFRDSLGEQIKIGNQWFTVVGVMEDKLGIGGGGRNDLPIRNMNEDIYIPITTSMKRYPMKQFESELNRFVARVTDTNKIQEAANIINHTMERRHNRIEDFHIIVPESLLRQSQQTQKIFNIVMGAIAGISLLVGGIGIMNIMLASVLERTREIGIRRAVGATRKDILGQFLLEAVVLSFTGGLMGIILGFVLTKVISFYADWRTIVSWQSILLAFWVSAVVGIIFGYYPARQAALKEPIESLRYE
ncbi:MAG: ABC transporter permease [Candidatus Latescibacteria bacterium]|nr:ABC transporter permease [Candidatus Latescibacterota bacterium]